MLWSHAFQPIDADAAQEAIHSIKTSNTTDEEYFWSDDDDDNNLSEIDEDKELSINECELRPLDDENDSNSMETDPVLADDNEEEIERQLLLELKKVVEHELVQQVQEAQREEQVKA